MLLTTRMTKSFEADATKALFELTAKSVMSPFIHINKRRLNDIKGKQTYQNYFHKPCS